MDNFTATEIAYKNGYNQALKEFVERAKEKTFGIVLYGEIVPVRYLDQIAKEIKKD